MPLFPHPPLTRRALLRSPGTLVVLSVGISAGILAAGFAPFWAPPVAGAALVSASAGGLAGALTSRARARSALAGAATCAGLALGIVGYVAARQALLPTASFLEIEIAIGAVLGGLPGVLLWRRWFGRRAEVPPEPR